MFDIVTLKGKKLFELQEIARSLKLKNTTQLRKKELLEKIISALEPKVVTNISNQNENQKKIFKII